MWDETRGEIGEGFVAVFSARPLGAQNHRSGSKISPRLSRTAFSSSNCCVTWSRRPVRVSATVSRLVRWSETSLNRV
jgi:hypothetical protein